MYSHVWQWRVRGGQSQWSQQCDLRGVGQVRRLHDQRAGRKGQKQKGTGSRWNGEGEAVQCERARCGGKGGRNEDSGRVGEGGCHT